MAVPSLKNLWSCPSKTWRSPFRWKWNLKLFFYPGWILGLFCRRIRRNFWNLWNFIHFDICIKFIKVSSLSWLAMECHILLNSIVVKVHKFSKSYSFICGNFGLLKYYESKFLSVLSPWSKWNECWVNKIKFGRDASSDQRTISVIQIRSCKLKTYKS